MLSLEELKVLLADLMINIRSMELKIARLEAQLKEYTNGNNDAH